jgi:hypothetical protein
LVAEVAEVETFQAEIMDQEELAVEELEDNLEELQILAAEAVVEDLKTKVVLLLVVQEL